MRLHAAFWGVVILGFWGSAASDARAQGFLGGFGYGNNTGLPYNYFQSQEQLPYYSKFPPVYYSYPVPRSYGYSPFAYPPGVMTPEIEFAATPLDIPNPFFVPKPSSTPAPQKPAPAPDAAESLTGNGINGSNASVVTAPRAKMIINPYATDAGASEPLGDVRLTRNP